MKGTDAMKRLLTIAVLASACLGLKAAEPIEAYQALTLYTNRIESAAANTLTNVVADVSRQGNCTFRLKV